MIEDLHFLRNVVVDVDAAVVGVGKSRWEHVTSIESSVEAQRIMERERFDILPIVDDRVVRAYYRTRDWNDYSEVIRCEIDHRDVIHYRTPIRDVIKSFAGKGEEKRHFYFLGNDGDIVGLVSVVNLNCRQVKTYLYSLISELELRLSDYLDSSVADETLYQHVFGGDVSPQLGELKKDYDKAKRDGLDVRLVEHLFLLTLCSAIVEFGLHEALGYTKGRFKRTISSINDLRNMVSHPTRSTITVKKPVTKLWERLDFIEEALFRLKRIEKPKEETQ